MDPSARQSEGSATPRIVLAFGHHNATLETAGDCNGADQRTKRALHTFHALIYEAMNAGFARVEGATDWLRLGNAMREAARRAAEQENSRACN